MINNFLIQDAIAQSSEAVAKNDFSLASFVPLILIFAVFYFLIVRPQSKKMKQQQQMIENLKAGDKVVTSSGMIGVIKKIDQKENQIELEISENVTIKMIRHYITDLAEKDKEKEKKK